MQSFATANDVADLCKKEDKKLVIYQNKVYDVEKFMISHPGGKAIIEKEIGKEIDQPFDDEGHSKAAKSYFGARVPQVGTVLDKDL